MSTERLPPHNLLLVEGVEALFPSFSWYQGLHGNWPELVTGLALGAAGGPAMLPIPMIPALVPLADSPFGAGPDLLHPPTAATGMPALQGAESPAGSARPPVEGADLPRRVPATYAPHEPREFRTQPLQGISERTQQQHFGLYRGYVQNTNEVRRLLAQAPERAEADHNHSRQRSLQRGHTWNWCGVKNHEMFFSILSGTPRAPDGPILRLIERDFGSFERFRADFEAAARSVRGWAMLVYDLDDGRLHIFAGDRHDDAVWNAVVLMGIDVFEHAYFIDHGRDKARYIEAFFANLDWEAVNARLRQYRIDVPGVA